MTDSLVYKLLCIVSIFGAGRERIWELYSKLGSFENIYNALRSGHKEQLFYPAELMLASRIKREQILFLMEECEKSGIGMICFGDENYPEKLKNIHNPPVLLFYKGNAEILKSDYIFSIVGARKISDYSLKITKYLSGTLAENNMVIASGFAEGTDINAHLAAVRNGGKTIAVLGCGIDYNYPAPNIQYRDELLANGVFVSEYFPKTAAKLQNFTDRNRILTGLSLGTAVIEASEKSGSLNSAQHALSQGRDLWVVPVHDITDGRYGGNRKLLCEGAAAVYSADDVLKQYFENVPVPRAKTDSSASYKKEKKRIEKPAPVREEKTVQEASPKPQESEKTIPMLNDDEKIVYDILRKAGQPLTADEIVVRSKSDIFSVLSLLTNLEIAGAVSSDDGQTYYVK